MGSLLAGNDLPTPDKVRAAMAELPPVDPADVALAKTYAPLIRDDYATALVEVVTETDAGKRARLFHLGLGALGGALVGGLGVYLFAGRR